MHVNNLRLLAVLPVTTWWLNVLFKPLQHSLPPCVGVDYGFCCLQGERSSCAYLRHRCCLKPSLWVTMPKQTSHVSYVLPGVFTRITCKQVTQNILKPRLLNQKYGVNLPVFPKLSEVLLLLRLPWLMFPFSNPEPNHRFKLHCTGLFTFCQSHLSSLQSHFLALTRFLEFLLTFKQLRSHFISTEKGMKNTRFLGQWWKILQEKKLNCGLRFTKQNVLQTVFYTTFSDILQAHLRHATAPSPVT